MQHILSLTCVTVCIAGSFGGVPTLITKVLVAIGGLVLSDDIVRKVPVVRLPNYTNHYSCRHKQLTTVNIYDVSRISVAIH